MSRGDGAVLFVVMMLDVDFAEMKQGALQYARSAQWSA